MPDSKHSPMNAMQPAAFDTPTNGVVAHPGCAQLSYRDHAVLPRRDFSDPPFRCVAFPAHTADKATQAEVLPLDTRLGCAP